MFVIVNKSLNQLFICLFILELQQERDNQQNLDPQKSGVIVAQIINLYKYIFPEDPTETEQERLMLQVLEKCMRSGQGAKNTNVTGDFRVWVYLYNKEGETFNIAVSGFNWFVFLFFLDAGNIN